MSEIDEQLEKRICGMCVGETFLRDEILASGSEGKCSYCGDDGVTYSISELADRIGPVFEANYELSPSEPDAYQSMLLRDKESNYDWFREGDSVEDVIAGLAEIDNDIAADIVELLSEQSDFNPFDDGGEEDPFGTEAMYVEKPFDQYRLESMWQAMSNDVLHRSRYFSTLVSEFLDELFEDIHDKTGREGPALMTVAPDEGIYLYRARVTYDRKKLRAILEDAARQLAAPHGRHARAGRMNAAGISVFYGAFTADTCVAEVRPPVGAQVVIGMFKLLRPVKLLDLKALEAVFVKRSFFDPKFQSDGEKCQFLRTLSRRFSAPVLPGAEDFDYLLTQVICEYLASIEPAIDGVIFPSVQTGAERANAVLFSRASSVAMPPPGTKTKFEIFYGDDPEDQEYYLMDFPPQSAGTVPKEPTVLSPLDFAGWHLSQNDLEDLTPPEPTLELVADKIEVRTITGVAFSWDSRSVRRYLRESSDQGIF